MDGKNGKLFVVIEPIDLSELEKSLDDGITRHHLMGRRDSGTTKWLDFNYFL